METRKIAKLEKQLLYTGLGDIPSESLRKNISYGLPEFFNSLSKKFDDNEVIAVAQFRKGKEDYFFNSYGVETKQGDGSPIKILIKVESPESVLNENGQKEWINSTITLKEAYNLTQGRSISKDFVAVDKDQSDKNRKYNAWEILDFKNPNNDGTYPITKIYNFDIAAELSLYPIKELLNEKYKAQLLESLKRGNLQSVTFLNADGTEEKMKIEANAAFRSINIYDAQGNRISLNKKIQQSQTTAQEQNASQEVGDSGNKKNTHKQEVPAGDAEDGPRQVNKNKRKGQKIA